MELKVSTDSRLIQEIEQTYMNNNIPGIHVGDTVKLGVSITEGSKERIQFAEGVIIAKRNGGINATITMRRVMQGVGVERIYLLNSPKLKSIEVLRKSIVRRAKLYYLRERVGKATRLQQSFKVN